ncbi:MAG: penicillin acylase family protein [Bacteroidota bacterium]
MRWIKFVLSLVVTLVLIYVLSRPWGPITFQPGTFLSPFHGFWQNAESLDTEREPRIEMEGLTKPVSVVLDERHVPHIFAENEKDLYFMQGYLTAQDRLWQMEFQVMAAAGRLTEIVGRGPEDAVLNLDREARRKGMAWSAKSFEDSIMANPISKKMAVAYTAGVNAHISSLHPKDYPIEYKLLNYQPEEWSIYKTCLLLKYMSDMLTGNTNELRYLKSYLQLPAAYFDPLYAVKRDFPAPIIPIRPKPPFEATSSPQVPKSYQPDSVFRMGGTVSYSPDHLGSNNWVVHGSRTVSGNPMLANDPHLGLNLPSIWYEMQLHTPDFNVYGATIPGAPGVIIGFNDSIAWGQTNAARDVLDLFRIDFLDEREHTYQVRNKLLKAEPKVEQFIVKGEPEFLDTVYYTEFGPVIFDDKFGDAPFPMAVRWTAHEPSNELLTFVELAKANNHKDFLHALSHYKCPGQNFAFASANGDIALKQQGLFVNRWKGQGRLPLDAKDSAQHWQGFIPIEHNPHSLNPEEGFLQSTNQVPVGPEYPYQIEGRYEAFRPLRITQLLEDTAKMTIRRMQDLQQDNYGELAAQVMPMFMAALDTPNLSESEGMAFQELANWNYMYHADSVSPTIFQAWWSDFRSRVWQDNFPDWTYMWPTAQATIELMRDSAESLLYDLDSTSTIENRDTLIQLAFASSVKRLKEDKPEGKDWTWSTRKATRVRHLTRVLGPFNRYNIHIGGYKNILNATSERDGPSWRMVVELGDRPKAYGIYPGGQSGNPGSPQYDAFIDDWAKGEYYPLWFMQSSQDTRNTPLARQIYSPTPDA